ncbi:MAG: hypothetical protein FWF81_09670 [Defluviitaleaceae bacterium]|nr:hypothetical protein [Defluviitaleaceae bacterium]
MDKMSAEDIKHSIFMRFFEIGGNHDFKKLDALSNELNELKNEYRLKDPQIDNVMALINVFLEEYERNNFFEACIFAKPIMNRLLELDDLDYYDINTLAAVVDYEMTLAGSQKLAKRALAALEHYNREKRYLHIKLAIHGNMLFRLVRSRLFKVDEDNNEANQTKIFKEHYAAIMKIFKDDEVKNKFMPHWAATQIRKGLFEQDYSDIDEMMNLIKKEGSEDAHKMMQDEINSFNAYVGDAINYTQCNSLIGFNLNRIRTASKTTAAEVGVYLGVDADYIYRVELGIDELNCHQLYKLSHFFNVKTHNFFEGNNLRAKVDPTSDYVREEIAERLLKLSGESVYAIRDMIKAIHPEPKDKGRKRLFLDS